MCCQLNHLRGTFKTAVCRAVEMLPDMLHLPTDHQPLLEQTPSGDAVFDNC